MTTLVIEFKNIENEKYKKVFSNSKAETIINESNNTFKSIYVTYLKNILEKVRVGLLIRSSVTLLKLQSTILYLVVFISNYQKN